MANAVIMILEKIVSDHPEYEELITWSDSCISQNRNSIMSFAMQHFLRQHPRIQKVTMKYSEAGHSLVQEVDNIHSQIERYLKHIEIHSPLSLVRHLKSVRRDQPFIVMQLKKVWDYKSCTKLYKYNLVPYTKFKALVFR